jgi:hypothetical protein
MITIILFGALLSLLLYYFFILKSRYEYFLRRNIPGPPPKLFFGNYLNIWSTPSFNQQIQKWTRQYGPIYGIFEGTRPIYVISDVDFLQEVYIKQFSIFHSRHNNILTRMFKTNTTSLFTAYGNQWRRQRHVINPTFSTAKLKMMTPLMNKCITSIMKKLDENIENEFNIFVLYKRLTMDVICKSSKLHPKKTILILGHCAFGIDTDLQNDIDNIYMRRSLAVFSRDYEQTSIVRLSNLIPSLNSLLIKLMDSVITLINFLRVSIPSIMGNIEDPPQLWIFKQIEKVIKQRLTSKLENKRIDLLQLMLDASTQDEVEEVKVNYLIDFS